jgi:ribosomal protein S18 acetylase RimI-like enzyme
MVESLKLAPLRLENLDAICRFNERLTAGALPASGQKSVLTEIVSGPDKVCDVSLEDQRVGIGVIIDSCANAHDAAELSILALDGNPSVMEEILSWALPILQEGPKQVIDLPNWSVLPFPPEWLERHGFTLGYSMYTMKFDPGLRQEPVPELPKEWRWQEYDDRYFEGYFETVRESFKEIPGAFIPEESAFRKRCYTLHPKASLLLEGDEVVGFVRIQLNGPQTGELAILGRHPKFRGRGAGLHIVERGLRQLQALDAFDIHLEVAATNRKALALYERFGFQLTGTRPVFRKKLRNP